MSEAGKSGVFGLVAAASAVLAFAFQGSSGTTTLPPEVGAMMFPDFHDALAAKSLTITRFDESLGRLEDLEVKQVDGRWRLPSHEGYPADAENKIRDATTPFVDLEIIRVASENETDHQLYGVVKPDKTSSEITDQGVGTRVVVKDSGGKSLVDLIIGKEVKDAEGQRYVCRTDKPRVYVCEIDPDDLPVRFEEWIEKDLLDVSSFDIERLTLKDYTFAVQQQLFRQPTTQFTQRLEVSLVHEDNKWQLDSLQENLNNRFVESELLDSEEVDQERINGLRTALTDLEIVDVDRKPTGLSSDLQADESFFSNEEGVNSLVEKGFYPVQLDGVPQILSSEGEVIAGTKDGVEYVLRFGRDEGIETKGDETSVNRYLLVSARFNEGYFDEPEYEDLPELPGGSVELPPADNSDSESVDADVEPDACGPQAENDEVEVSEDEIVEATADPKADAEVDTEASADSDQQVSATEEAAGEGDSTKADALAEIRAERERIEKENQRKRDEYDDKVEKAKEKVAELNYRFADWYYVISEDMYKKIHLSRSDIVKESDEAKESGFGLDAFKKIGEESKDLLKD
ncbi:MAG: DUF4340 domain-containing protein [Planctomycetales bacterium]|nr:DUF4340 domain-containing protein [Planctomycetales bacterium]